MNFMQYRKRLPSGDWGQWYADFHGQTPEEVEWLADKQQRRTGSNMGTVTWEGVDWQWERLTNVSRNWSSPTAR